MVIFKQFWLLRNIAFINVLATSQIRNIYLKTICNNNRFPEKKQIKLGPKEQLSTSELMQFMTARKLVIQDALLFVLLFHSLESL